MLGISRAPEINRFDLVWYNTPSPLSLADLRGRIGILDFWTSCCINCIHMIPTLRRVEQLFPDKVAVVGVHSPKFSAEQRPEAVGQAILRYGITHPVAHDPAMALWQAYAIRAWPTMVFLSPDGYIIGHLPGEPDPDALIKGLQGMLSEFAAKGTLSPAVFSPAATPEVGGALRFPGKIKPCRLAGDRPGWAVADTGHHQIVVFDDQGRESARYGSGTAGFEDGPAAVAGFNAPQGLICGRRTLWVADTGNHALRGIDRASGQVSTLAGQGERGAALRQTRLGRDLALASPWDVERIGDALFLANAGTHQIARFDLSSLEIRPIAGTGGENIVDGPAEYALLAQPSGLAATADGRGLYFADAETSSIRLLTLGANPWIHSIVGHGLFEFGHRNGPFDQALLQHPMGVAMDDETLLVADSYNGVLRRLDLNRARVEDIDLGHCEDSLCLPLGEAAGLAVAGPARLLVSDTNNHRIVEVDLQARRHRTWTR